MEQITRGLSEVVGIDHLRDICAQRNPTVYWGTAPTGKPHLGYLVPLKKIADFINVGCDVTILLADLHATLDNQKSTWSEVDDKVEWYRIVISKVLESFGCSSEPKFVRGTSYQLSESFNRDVYRMQSLCTIEQAKRAGSEVVKQSDDPMLSSVTYPILQALDEQYIDADCQLGGVDQRKIFMFARDYLPTLGYGKKRVHLMNPILGGLTSSGKMSSSEPNSKIELDDSDDVICKKISRAYSIDGVSSSLFSILELLVFPSLTSPFIVDRDDKWGGPIVFATFDELKTAFEARKLSSADLKPSVANAVINIVAPIRKTLEPFYGIRDKAYPQPTEVRTIAPTQATIASLRIVIGTVFGILRHPKIDARIATVTTGGGRVNYVKLPPDYHLHAFQADKVALILNVEPKRLLNYTLDSVLLAPNFPGSLVIPNVPDGEELQFAPVLGPQDEVVTSKRLDRVVKNIAVCDGFLTWGDHRLETSQGPVKFVSNIEE
jgi:tyrosyl-tRNA synthetase